MTTTRKQLTLNVGEKGQQIRAWLTLVSGIRKFTNREIDVLEVIILKRQELVANQIRGKYLSELLFSINSRREYTTRLQMTEFNFANLLSSIKKKGAIVVKENDAGDKYEDIDYNLIPADEITIKLLYDKGTEDTGTN